MTSLSRVVWRLASLFPLVRRFAESITGMLTSFDRVICKGYLPIMHQAGLEGFVDGVLGIWRCDFPGYAKQQQQRGRRFPGRRLRRPVGDGAVGVNLLPRRANSRRNETFTAVNAST